METTERLTPCRAIHVGEIIKDELEAREMSQRELCAMTGLQPSNLNALLRGKRDLTAEQALLIGAALDIEPKELMRMQSEYELDLAAISQRVREQTKATAIWSIVTQYLSEKALGELTRLPLDVRARVKSVFGMCHVTSLDGFVEKCSEMRECALFKKSEALTTDQKALLTWMLYCCHIAYQKPLAILFDRNCAGALAAQIKEATLDNREVVPRLQKILSDSGIRLLIVPKQGQMPVDGFSFWKDENPTIALTLRKRNIDNVVFTLMHELGHVLLHLHEGDTGEINSECAASSDREREADKFAQESLIPPIVWSQFVRRIRNASAYKLKPIVDELSAMAGVHPQICFGRCLYEIGNYKVKSPYDRSI